MCLAGLPNSSTKNLLTNEIIFVFSTTTTWSVMFIRRKRNLDPSPIPLLCLYQGCSFWPNVFNSRCQFFWGPVKSIQYCTKGPYYMRSCVCKCDWNSDFLLGHILWFFNAIGPALCVWGKPVCGMFDWSICSSDLRIVSFPSLRELLTLVLSSSQFQLTP